MSKREVIKPVVALVAVVVIIAGVFIFEAATDCSEEADCSDSIGILSAYTKVFDGMESFVGSLMGFPSITGYYAAGDGSLGDPYEIVDCDGLQNMSSNVTVHYELTQDIDCSATSGWNSGDGFVPVGNGSVQFTGSFDGNNHTISDLYINRSTTNNVGLFGYISGGNVSNLGLVDANITGQIAVGALAGRATTYSNINSVYATGRVNGTNWAVGGLVGIVIQSYINSSYATGSVTGTGIKVGGLVGEIQHSSVDNSYATGNVTGSSTSVGGLTAYLYNTHIDNSYATGDVTSSNERVGGLAGTLKAGSINHSYATGDITGSNRVAGIAGYISNSAIIDNSYSTGNITGSSSVGGLAGYLNSATISNSFWYNHTGDNAIICVGTGGGSEDCTAKTDLTYFYNVSNEPMDVWSFPPWDDVCSATHGYQPLAWQGLSVSDCSAYTPSPPPWSGSGTLADPYQVTDCDNLQLMTTNLTAHYKLMNDVNCSNTTEWNSGAGFVPVGNISSQFTGSLDGNNHTISDLYINRTTQYVGLFGYATSANISNVGLVDVNITAYQYVGGLVGRVLTTTGGISRIFNSYATGSVTSSSNFIGGLVGYFSGSDTGTAEINNSYSSVDVTGNNNVGGLVGKVSSSKTNTVSKINNSYAIGNVTGNHNVGGLVGEVSADWNYGVGKALVDNSYATGEVSGGSNVGGLLGHIYDAYSAGDAEIDNSYWYNNTGDDANDCYGSNSGGSVTCTVQTDLTYFYNISNEPMVSWSYPPWDDICDDEGHTPLEYENITDVSQCNGYVIWDGSGTVGDPYQVTNCTELQQMNTSLSSHFKLMNDINCSNTSNWNSGAGFNPVGTGPGAFTGSLDGNDKVITDLYVNRSTTDYVGLFAKVNGSNITDVGLTGGNVTGDDYVGSLVGYIYSYALVDNVYATGSVTGDAYVGGLVGWQKQGSTIDNSYVTGNINGQDMVGGLTGKIHKNSNINNSYATADVNGTTQVGGLIGYAYNNCRIDNSYTTGNITGTTQVGGLSGEMYYHSSIDNSYAIGNVTGNDQVGGLAGRQLDYSNIDRSYATGSVTGNNYVGGLSGAITGSNINNSYWYNNTGDDANDCYGSNSGGSVTCTAKTDITYFYNVSNEPLVSWSYPPWDAVCSATQGYPPLAYQGLDVTECSAYVPWDGSGTVGDPYQVTNCTELQQMNTRLSSHFKLMNDIDCTNTSNWNSGDGFNPIGAVFNGSFDGQNYTIDDLYINRSTTDNVGLFAKVKGSNITDVGLTGGDVTGDDYVGSLAGYIYSYALVDNVYAVGSVTGETYVGGLVGWQKQGSTIDNSYVAGNVTGDTIVGGLVGVVYVNSNVDNSYATGNIDGLNVVGGLAGNVARATVNNSYATVNVTGNLYVGGLLGQTYFDNNTVDNSYATGNVNGSSDVGGLIGRTFQTNINHSYATADVNGSNNVGGLIGYAYNHSNIDNSSATGNVNGTGTRVGGLVGYLLYYSTIDNSSATGNVTGNNQVGGLAGYVVDSDVDNSYATGNVNGSNYVGGLAGKLYASTSTANIGESYATGNVRGSGGTGYVGGLAGQVIGFGGSSISSVYDSYATGDVTSTHNNIGGLIGDLGSNGKINNSYATGDVNGINKTGGLVGYQYYSYIYNSFATGSVNGTNYVGGLVGVHTYSNVNNSYWYNNTGDDANTCIGNDTDVGGGVPTDCEETAGGTAGAVDILSYFFDVSNLPLVNWSYPPWDAVCDDKGYTPLAFEGLTDYTQCRGFIWDGSGTPADPYQVTTCTNLEQMSTQLSSHFKLMNDINCTDTSASEAGFEPIGAVFNGSFDGQNYTIDGLYINRSTTDNVGLFGKVKRGNISDVGLTGVDVTGYEYVGSLAGYIYSYAYIDNVYATGSVTGSNYVGGLTGNVYQSYVNNSYAAADVNGSDGVGGLAGYFSGGSNIDNSYANGSVNGSSWVGGLIGVLEESNISNSYATGNVNGGGNSIGGLAGYIYSSSSIDNSYATGDVTGNDIVGGLVGVLADNSNITNSYTTGSITGNNYVGGLAGYIYSYSSIDNSYTTGNINGNSGVGGLVGQMEGECNISNSYTTGNINGTNKVGGLVGCTYSYCNVDNSYATGNINGTNQVGGLAGLFADSKINHSNAAGTVTGSDFVGGLVGSTEGTAIGQIDNSYATGSVTGNISVGGLVGHAYYTNIDNSYATGSVTGNDQVGGLAGQAYDYCDIDNSYATGNINGTGDNVGGLIGFTYHSNIDNSFAAGTVTGNNSVGGLIGEQEQSFTNNSYATGSVTGAYYVGGLVGEQDRSDINSAFAIGSVTGTYAVGGLAGYMQQGANVDNSYATGSVTGTTYVGGLIGVNYLSDINNSYWYDNTGDDANTCVGVEATEGGGPPTDCEGNFSGTAGTVNTLSYFYDVADTNPPYYDWDFPPWDDVCDDIYYPPLAFQGLIVSECTGYAAPTPRGGGGGGVMPEIITEPEEEREPVPIRDMPPPAKPVEPVIEVPEPVVEEPVVEVAPPVEVPPPAPPVVEIPEPSRWPWYVVGILLLVVILGGTVAYTRWRHKAVVVEKPAPPTAPEVPVTPKVEEVVKPKIEKPIKPPEEAIKPPEKEVEPKKKKEKIEEVVEEKTEMEKINEKIESKKKKIDELLEQMKKSK
jgi:hypothetical protein